MKKFILLTKKKKNEGWWWKEEKNIPRHGRGIMGWGLLDWTIGCWGERVWWWKGRVGEQRWGLNLSRRGKWVPSRISGHSTPWIGICSSLHHPNHPPLVSLSPPSLSHSLPSFSLSADCTACFLPSPRTGFKQNLTNEYQRCRRSSACQLANFSLLEGF